MTRADKLKQFFDFMPKNGKPTKQDYRETAAKIGDITDIADVFFAHAQAHGVDASAELETLAKAKQQAGQSEPAAIIKTFSDIKPEKIN